MCLAFCLSQLGNGSVIRRWNSRIRQLVDQGNFNGALFQFREMKRDGAEPNNWTFPFVSKACAKIADLKTSQMVHTQMVKSRDHRDVFVQTPLVDMYIKCSRLDMARSVFLKMPYRDIASWNVMLKGFAQSGVVDGVFGAFRDMRFAGIVPDAVTVMGVCQGVLCVKDPGLAKAVHCFGLFTGVDADVSVVNTLISVYAKCGELDSAECLFNGVATGSRTVVSWNSMIAGYAGLGKSSNALASYKLMLCEGLLPDLSTIISMLSSYTQPESLSCGMLIHCHGIKSGCDSSISVTNTLISMYSNCGEVDLARCLFNCMPKRCQVSWTVMISGYAEKGDVGEAFHLFSAMEASGEKPDSVTIIALLSCCGQTGALEAGKRVHAYANFQGFEEDVIVCNALLDMYSKCGSMNDAWELFSAMPHKTIVSWTTMIKGCALNGLFPKALNLFGQMVELGLKPNHVTFVAILHACAHAGFLDQGMEYFNMMKEVYRINPGLDHYSCIIDLLGRKGKLAEAVKFIHDMPIKPDAAIWGSLLSACKVHRDVEVGEYAADQLFALEPDAAAPYVEMANLYASAGQWRGVASIRNTMKHKMVRKFPGQSVINVEGETHVFTVEDRDHSASKLLYEALDSLALQIQRNCTSQLSSILHCLPL